MEFKKTGYVDLNELICALAYGERMTFEQMAAYEREKGLAPVEAGQKSVDPPLLAVGEVINGGVNAFADGITWLDADYDERTGEVLRDRSGEAERPPEYRDALGFVLEQAAEGFCTLYARSPKDRGNNDVLGDYAPIPRDVFIAEHLFAPGNPPVFWPRQGGSWRDANWFYPKLRNQDALAIKEKWRRTKGAECTYPESGSKPTVRLIDQTQTESAYLERVKKLLSQGRGSSFDEDWDAMKELVPEIPRRRVRKLRERFAPPEWKAPGRRGLEKSRRKITPK